jgi:hypothetical protein
MANITESATYESTIYEIATTDPVGGGPNGVVNVQAKQLANRTKWLRQIADEVTAARGNYQNLLARLDALIPLDVESQNANTGALLEAIGAAGLANREIYKEHTQRKQTGTILLVNKGIVSGCTVTKSDTANRNISCASGIIFARGQLFPFFGEENGAIVPENNEQNAQTCYAYLYFNSDGSIEFATTPVGQTVPENGIPLYLVTIPPGNNGQNDPNLANVSLSSVRRMEANFPAFYANPLYANVILPFPLPDAGYAVSLDIISVSGSGFQRGEVYPMDRNVNGFKIYYNGVADDLLIRWEISKPGL